MTMWIFDGIDTNNDGFADWGEVVPSLAETTDSKESCTATRLFALHKMLVLDIDGRTTVDNGASKAL